MDVLRFEEWMRRALQDPLNGYYRSGVNAVGRTGDFSTSATAGKALGSAIAGWLRHASSLETGVNAVIEIGGGDGSLSAQVRQSLGWWRRRTLTWCMVETSGPLRELQRQRLGSSGARWFEKVTDALEACGGRAYIFHNELVDAFPVRVLQWCKASGRWQELWLRRGQIGWHEEFQPADLDVTTVHHHAALSAGRWASAPLHDGQRVELHESYLHWLRELAPSWTAGAMLTVDYGDTFPQLYRRRPHGTLRAYLRHHRITGADVYANMGRQDITADVNFTDLLDWGESLGWETREFCTQREFLLRHVPGIKTRAASGPAIAHVTDEHGAGGAFKVLEQRVSGRGRNRLRAREHDVSTGLPIPDRQE